MFVEQPLASPGSANKEVFRIGLDFMVSMLLSALVERVGVSRMRDF